MVAAPGHPLLPSETDLVLGNEAVHINHMGVEGSEFHYLEVIVDGVRQFIVPDDQFGWLVALPPHDHIGLRFEHGHPKIK